MSIVGNKVINRGTGAGGANTNKNGKKFEAKTCCEKYLLDRGFTKKILAENQIIIIWKIPLMINK